MDLRYDSIAALIEAAKQSGRKLSELVLEQQAVQMEQSADELYEIMRKSYAVMAASVEEGKAPGKERELMEQPIEMYFLVDVGLIGLFIDDIQLFPFHIMLLSEFWT